MASYTYFLVLAATVAVPLVLSLMPWRLRWSGQEWRRLTQVFLLVSLPFVLLDVYSHASGWWAYNPDFVTGFRSMGLPLEEIMFFIVVPFACLYLFSAVARMARSEQLRRPWHWRLVLGMLIVGALTLALIEPRERTLFDVFVFVLVATVGWIKPPSRVEILWLGAVVLLFLIVNTILTALPVVTYDATFGSRYRIGTIPFEDVLYNFSFLVLCLGVWHAQPITRLVRAVRRS